MAHQCHLVRTNVILSEAKDLPLLLGQKKLGHFKPPRQLTDAAYCAAKADLQSKTSR
jgi:hypothetical protein